MATQLAATKFTVVAAVTGQTVLQKEAKPVKTPLGDFLVLDFSEVTTPGRYVVKAGNAATAPFAIGEQVWRDSVITKTVNLFYCERCGDAIPGIHDRCHQDWRAGHDGREMVINGGWHDAGDLSQGVVNTSESALAMLELAERLRKRDPELARRLTAEAKWGLVSLPGWDRV